MALLAAVAGQVATALENGRLYGQLQLKAKELDRMHQFSESIIESLSDGLVVLDPDDQVLRWNARMERLYGVSGMLRSARSLRRCSTNRLACRCGKRERGPQPERCFTASRYSRGMLTVIRRRGGGSW